MSNIAVDNVLDRIYGSLAYEDLDQVKKTIDVINMYSVQNDYDEFLVSEIRLELYYAVSTMKNLHGNRMKIVQSTLKGTPTIQIAKKLGVSSQYVRKVRTELFEVIRKYFSDLVPCDVYKENKKLQRRYAERLKDYRRTQRELKKTGEGEDNGN